MTESEQNYQLLLNLAVKFYLQIEEDVYERDATVTEAKEAIAEYMKGMKEDMERGKTFILSEGEAEVHSLQVVESYNDTVELIKCVSDQETGLAESIEKIYVPKDKMKEMSEYVVNTF